MGNDTPDLTTIEWFTLPEIAEMLGESPSRVRRLLEDRHLIGSARGGAFRVPVLFLLDDEPVISLRGTIMVLQDAGFSDDEAIDWMLGVEESIGVAPIELLRAGRKSEVRRVARSLA